jgi:hypothetical protein
LPDSPAPQSTPEMQLQLKYDGPALADGRMNARDLAPAIMAFADAVERTTELTYRGAGRVHVEVVADFRRGSFAIELAAVATQGELLTLTLEDLANISGLLGISIIPGMRGLWHIVKRQAGRPVEKVERNGDIYNVTVQGGASFTLNSAEFQLFSDSRLRSDLDKIAEPLERPGVENLTIGPPRAEEPPPVKVLKAERGDYSPNLVPAEEIGIERGTMWVQLVAPNFKEGNKWRFEREGEPFFAEILDPAFLRRVRKGEVQFAAGDTFRVVMQTRVSQSAERLHLDRAVVRVLQQWTHVDGEVVKITFPETVEDGSGGDMPA